MTEQEWLESDNSKAMLEFVEPKTSRRKLRLFAAACFGRLTHLLTDEWQQRAIKMLENASDEKDFRKYDTGVVQRTRRAFNKFDSNLENSGIDDPYFVGLMLYRELVSSSMGHHATLAPEGLVNSKEEQLQQCHLLRCIYGPSPFHSISCNPEEFPSSVVELAQTIYREKSFEQ